MCTLTELELLGTTHSGVKAYIVERADRIPFYELYYFLISLCGHILILLNFTLVLFHISSLGNQKTNLGRRKPNVWPRNWVMSISSVASLRSFFSVVLKLR